MESLAVDLRTAARTPLEEAHVAAMREVGDVRDYAAGEMLIRLGDPIETFFWVESGEVEAVNPITGGRYGEATLGPTQFFGEITFLSGGRSLMGARCCQDSRILCVPRPAMLELMSRIPEMSDIIVTVLAGRRRRLLESNEAALTILGADRSRELRRIAAFANRNRIPVRMLDLETPEAEAEAQTCSILPSEPAVIFGKHDTIEDPTPRKIAERLGLDMGQGGTELFDVLIVGGGPAGIAAGVYAGAEGMSALVVEDLAIGGQAGTSSRIENYMGFPTGISGGDLCWRGEVQAMKFGTRFAVPRRARALATRPDGSFCVTLDDGSEVCARSLVIATGVQYRQLPIDRLADFEGAGVYYAATDVEARYCRDSDAVVIGGGNSAGQAAMYLARTAAHVHVLVRGPSLAASMSDYLLSRLERNSKVTIHYASEMTALEGGGHLDAVVVRDKTAGKHRRIETRGVFVMVGAAPNTAWLSDLVALDDKGFVRTGVKVGGGSVYETSHRGIFAVGDVRAGSVKRVASAVGEGSVVMSRVWEYLDAIAPAMAAE
ncbi:MAG: FAD-dependent oxidoreductase [Paracoccaceae bacterium]|nr:FAD-dependent oxidoreductase [Paracoccaceae bacterium]